MLLPVGAALIILLIWFSSRRQAAPVAEDEKTSAEIVMLSTEERVADPEKTGEEPQAGTEALLTDHPVAIMPQDERTLELFQEACSRAMIQFQQQPGNMPYSVAASAGLRKAMADLGYDPDRTLLYWLSFQYQTDVKKTADPGSLFRASENLLSIVFGDQAGEKDFALILESFPPELRSVALQRRADK